MEKLIFENKRAGSVDMIGDTAVRLDNLDGVSAECILNRQAIANQDGCEVQSVRKPERTITVNFHILAGTDHEQAMHDMYRIFAAGSEGTMTMYGRLGCSKIDYKVESCIIPPNQKPPVKGIITLLCADPYFRGLEDKEEIIAGSYSCFSFPFTFPSAPFYISRRMDSVFADIYNDGEQETGMTIIITAKSRVVNPAIINVETGEKARLRFTMEGGDVVKIVTDKGKKSVMLYRGGTEINIFNYTDYPFKFFTLQQGRNTFKYDADSGAGALDIRVQYSARYGAIYTNAPGAYERISDEEIERRIEDIARIVERGGLNG
ncbi:MAG: phage distal tail protein [Ruminiclostridium sp.]